MLLFLLWTNYFFTKQFVMGSWELVWLETLSSWPIRLKESMTWSRSWWCNIYWTLSRPSFKHSPANLQNENSLQSRKCYIHIWKYHSLQALICVALTTSFMNKRIHKLCEFMCTMWIIFSCDIHASRLPIKKPNAIPLHPPQSHIEMPKSKQLASNVKKDWSWLLMAFCF